MQNTHLSSHQDNISSSLDDWTIEDIDRLLVIQYVGSAQKVCAPAYIPGNASPQDTRKLNIAVDNQRCSLEYSSRVDMDPITALGVAAAVIQFIDYGTGLISKGREIYKSGELEANVELGEATYRLQNLIEPLRGSLNSGIQNAPPPSPADADRALKDICAKCIDLSEELSGLLGSLKLNLSVKHRRPASFQQAFRAVWNEKKIQGLKSRLGDLRSNLETHVLVDLRQVHDLLN
ncbi:hypothetical protein BOTNAR_0133g00120 [Botryotinia narcissicola]|uniref:Uncharacterized protein n=1 Tax=Botryotinia narcissicola TaxID=278944 RepID=A0A4Z1II56_9HELO|nr:hypothetical protein BOTNAR_0133g00120 [Botryotinia narcissicola]